VNADSIRSVQRRAAVLIPLEHMRDVVRQTWQRVVPHRMPMYRLAIVLFLLSTLVDTGSDERKGPLGLTLAMVTMIAATIIGLPLWKAPRDRVLLTCIVLIGLWTWAQLLTGHTLRTAVIIMSVLVFALVVGGVRSNQGLFWYQVRAAFVGPFLASVAYYLGFWKTTWTGRETFLEFNVNTLAFYLAVGFTIGCALVFRVKKRFRTPMVLATLLLLPPLAATGSRSGLGLALMVSVLFLGLRSRRGKIALLGVGAVVMAGAVLIYAFDTIVPESLADSAVLRRFSPKEFEEGEHLRFALILSGVDAFLERPWVGHGMDAPGSLQWRFNNLAYVNPDDTGVGTHNGFVDYLIMGGIPFTAVYLTFYGRIGTRLWRAARRAAPPMTDISALAFCLFLLCVADIMRGDSFGKYSWCLLGVGLQTLSLRAMRRGEEPSSSRWGPGR
jgi:O-antigen ligase